MTKARDLANSADVFDTVSTTELGYLDGVTSAVQTQLDAKVAASTVDAKGDLLAGSADNTLSRLAVGANDTVLTADSSTSTGLKWAAAAAGGKVLQVVSMSLTTAYTQTATTYTDITGYSLSITPSAATSKILVMFSPSLYIGGVATQNYQGFQIVRDSTAIMTNDNANVQGAAALGGGYTWQYIQAGFIYLDSPATTSSVTYKGQTKDALAVTHGINLSSAGNSTITLIEIGA